MANIDPHELGRSFAASVSSTGTIFKSPSLLGDAFDNARYNSPRKDSSHRTSVNIGAPSEFNP